MKEQLCLRRRFIVAGQVQGVGFRPFVYRLTTRDTLTGTVGNTTEGVCIEVQGSAHAVEAFGQALLTELPPLARITACEKEDLPLVHNEQSFTIVPSKGQGGHSVLVSPDMGICPDCLADMQNTGGRRFCYAFTNCTNCGPRYTITRSIPYDRAVTSMQCFPLCPECAAEYADPLDRRFHAQPNACPLCGPRLWLADSTQPYTAYPATDGDTRENMAQVALAHAAAMLHSGCIVAIKGLGGFLLACDATNASSIARLRQRKSRPHKPFAVMAADMETIQRVACPTAEEIALLLSPEKPIVLCRKRLSADALPFEIAPDVPHVGLMLPYTPLHTALFAHYAEQNSQKKLPLLVMTSGNAGGEPLCLGNREALSRLSGMADAFLLHDRDILVRVDDSVVAVQPQAVATASTAQHALADESRIASPLFFRRARGFVPRPVQLPPLTEAAPCVLGCGPELKATVCLTRGNEAFVSQHLGDLHNIETFNFFEEVVQHLEQLLQVQPAVLVCDAHPDFMASRYAQERAQQAGLPCIKLQHHAAHAAAVLAENQIVGPALALTLDGTGLGTDGSIWGGELLYMDLSIPVWRRLGRLATFPLPGGDAAIKEPWRIAQALLWQVEENAQRNAAPLWHMAFTPPWLEEQRQALPLLQQMVARNINCPKTSSCGRLFDAVAALLGICSSITYEGQAAIRLEAAIEATTDWQSVEPLPCPVHEYKAAWSDLHTLTSEMPSDNAPALELDTCAIFTAALAARQQGHAVSAVAAAFHLGLAQGLAAMAAQAARRYGLQQVALSGGVLQNATLSSLLCTALRAQGLKPLTHHELPAGDGGLSLGQAAWGRAWWLRQQQG